MRLDYRYVKRNYELYHYGVKRRSGRYPYGSGDRPYQREKRSRYEGTYELKKYQSPTSYMTKYKASRIALGVAAGTLSAIGLAYIGLPNMSFVAAPVVTKAVANRKYYAAQRRKLNYEEARNKDFGNPEKEKDLKVLKKKKQEASIEDDLKNVNPNYRKTGGDINCVTCTLAMEMRRRGYDVEANLGDGLSTTYALDKCFSEEPPLNVFLGSLSRSESETRKEFMKRSYNHTLNALERSGNGSRGYITIRYDKSLSNPIGHMMYWEVSNGVAKIYDPQNPHRNVEKIYTLCDPELTEFGRWDNLELNDNVTKYITSKGRRGK